MGLEGHLPCLSDEFVGTIFEPLVRGWYVVGNNVEPFSSFHGMCQRGCKNFHCSRLVLFFGGSFKRV